MKEKIIVTSQITYEAYKRATLDIILSHRIFKIIGFIVVLYMIASFVNYITTPGDSSLSTLISSLLVLLIIPVVFYFIFNRSMKKGYSQNLRFAEKATYELTQEELKVKGQTYEVKFTWEKVHKVIENKHSFMIFEAPNVAQIISKEKLSQDEIIQIESLLDSIPSLNYEKKV